MFLTSLEIPSFTSSVVILVLVVVSLIEVLLLVVFSLLLNEISSVGCVSPIIALASLILILFPLKKATTNASGYPKPRISFLAMLATLNVLNKPAV